MITSLGKRIEARKHDGQDSGDVVQTVILIAGFTIVALLLVVWVGTALMNKGVDSAKCVEEGGGHYSKSQSTSADACNGGTAAHSFTKDAGYTSRY